MTLVVTSCEPFYADLRIICCPPAIFHHFHTHQVRRKSSTSHGTAVVKPVPTGPYIAETMLMFSRVMVFVILTLLLGHNVATESYEVLYGHDHLKVLDELGKDGPVLLGPVFSSSGTTELASPCTPTSSPKASEDGSSNSLSGLIRETNSTDRPSSGILTKSGM
ncbi:hypothetical protein CRG98_003529 [Punica granatum]|uniref:Uncharacterized protein n=1 Tax=Punica granatum TaxID=22663 RepID=A0A2I0L643_PUNGR|nr:hypothetical protein CRG98_003529 [Punica granatum]